MKRYSFPVSIIALFAAFALALLMFFVANVYNQNLLKAYELVSVKNTDAATTIADTITTSVNNITSHLSVLLNVDQKDTIIDAKDSVKNIMIEQLRANKTMTSIFLADESGNYIKADQKPIPLIKEIDVNSNQEITYYKDLTFKTKTITKENITINPTNLNWYQRVNQFEKSFWASPYILDATQTPGMTVSMASINQNGEKIKVAGVDFTVDTISDALKDLAKKIDGEMIVFSYNGDVIGASFDYYSKDTGGGIAKISGFKQDRYIKVFDLIASYSFIGEIKDDGVEYIYFISMLPNSTNKQWYMASFIEKSKIFGNINILILQIVAISLLIVTLIYYLLARFFIRPIEKLKKMTQDIAEHKFEDIEEIDTRIKEFYDLSVSMVNMSQAIQKNEADLQKLIDSFVKILAESIDAKSPYTGGHCERVPEIAIMLAKEASNSNDDAFKNFKFSTQEQWREFQIAAWLHDCGKIVTPEYVVDKATKLETIYNRIHEIRTRFEVLHRDATIEYYQNVQKNPHDEEKYLEQMKQKQKQLQDDFAFIAQCNIGSEYMDNKQIERLNTISEQTWTQYFDDRLGLSIAEMASIGNVKTTIPQTRRVIENRQEHILNREKSVDKFDSKRYGFKVSTPKYIYNRGELYNLSVQKGTLNEEERFKINEHIIMTIKMLEQLPFTDNLKNIPEYAGNHHETMIGTGYPRRLSKNDISIPARIMAIADIFEALTASDRPYKHAKTLSESISIMSQMSKAQHIDSDLFKLFLTSGVYKEYAYQFLDTNQIDEVDISLYL